MASTVHVGTSVSAEFHAAILEKYPERSQLTQVIRDLLAKAVGFKGDITPQRVRLTDTEKQERIELRKALSAKIRQGKLTLAQLEAFFADA